MRDTSSGVPTVGITTSTSSVNEGSSFSGTFNYSGGVVDGAMVHVKVDFGDATGDASHGSDYGGLASGEFDFVSGTSGSIPFTITTTNNGQPGWTKDIAISIHDIGNPSQGYTVDTDHPGINVPLVNTNIGVTLGNGEDDQILEGDGSGMDNLTELTLTPPSQMLSGATVKLSVTSYLPLPIVMRLCRGRPAIRPPHIRRRNLQQQNQPML